MTGNLKVTIEDLNILLQSLNALTIKGSDAVRLSQLISKIEKCGDDITKKAEAAKKKSELEENKK